MTGFSETAEAGNAVAPCDEAIIPIFPLRYALSIDILRQLADTIYTKLLIYPTSIEDHPGQELLRIRQGYIFIYAENHRGQGSEPRQIWQAFRYETDGQDENSSVPRGDTQLQSKHAGGYNFVKYHWKDGTASGDWVILPNERSYPYAFVSNQATTIWVGYSEFRWPAAFFEKAEADVEFRERLMAKVEVQSRSGTHAAPLSQLEELAPIFRGPASKKPPLDIPIENALRHTAIETEQASKIVNCRNSREKGIVVALTDPIGEHLDVGRLISIHATTRAAYFAENQYPVLIGRAVENLVAKGQVKTVSAWPSWLVSVPTSPDYKKHFDTINDTLKLLDKQEEKLIEWFRGMLVRKWSGTVYDHLLVGHSFTSQMKPGSMGYQDCLAFTLLTLQRTFSLVNGSQLGSEMILNFIENGPQKDKDIGEVVDLTQKILDLVAKVVDGSIKTFHKAFLPALEITFTVIGKEIALAGTRYLRPSGAYTITQVMFHQNVGTVRTTDEISNAFQRMLNAEGFTNAPNPNAVVPRSSGEVVSVYSPLSPHVDSHIGLITFESRIDFMATQESLERFNRKARFERVGQGVGMLAAFLSLYTTLQNKNGGSYSKSDIGRFVDEPVVKLIAGFSDAYSAAAGIAQAQVVTNSAATQNALEIIFKRSKELTRAVNVSVASAGRATRFLQVSGRLAGIAGVMMSVGLAIEGAKRGDQAMLVGNGLMGLGAAALLFGALGPLAAIAVVAIVLGFVISLASLNEIELWVNFGFYGQSREYWGESRRSLSSNTETARVLAYEKDQNYARMSKFLNDELEDLVDRTSKLEIKNDVQGDRAFEIHCAIIGTPADLSKVDVSVTYERSWTLQFDRQASSLQKTFVSPGVVKVVPTPPDSRSWSNIDISVKVRRRNGGRHSESTRIELSDL